MFFAAFFNVAFFSQTMAALRGQPVSFQAGLRFAMSRWKPILFWSLMTGLIGFLIQKLQENFGFIGRMVIGLIGLAWSVASVFAIPVLVEGENIGNPVNVLRQSALTIKKTWGESLIGFVGLQLGGLLSLVVLLVCGAFAVTVAVMTQTLLVPMLTMVFWLLFTVALSYLSSVAGQIYQSALYLYASTGAVPTHFETRMMDSAWKRQ